MFMFPFFSLRQGFHELNKPETDSLGQWHQLATHNREIPLQSNAQTNTEKRLPHEQQFALDFNRAGGNVLQLSEEVFPFPFPPLFLSFSPSPSMSNEILCCTWRLIIIKNQPSSCCAVYSRRTVSRTGNPPPLFLPSCLAPCFVSLVDLRNLL